MPIFRSSLQARLLLHVLTGDEPTTAAELARRLDAPEATVAREVRRLIEAGLLRGERVGRAVIVHPEPDNPATPPLRHLLIVTFGPAPALEKALVGIAGIDEAYVHGSWAARYRGEPGKAPGDIDVLIVGRPSRAAVDTAVDGLETELGREVNLTYTSPQRWNDQTEPFMIQVRSRPLVTLKIPSRQEDVS